MSSGIRRFSAQDFENLQDRVHVVWRDRDLQHVLQPAADYAKTAIGGWLQNVLKITIAPDNMDAILEVFNILGAEASYA